LSREVIPIKEAMSVIKKNTTIKILLSTTRLPSSKVVVYLRVQKSLAAAKVVGAYV